MWGQRERAKELEEMEKEAASKVFPMAPETYIPPIELYGIMPEALLHAYQFWKHAYDQGPVILMGYPIQPELDGTYIRCEVDRKSGTARILRLTEEGARAFVSAKTPNPADQELLLNPLAARPGSPLWRIC